MGGIEIKRHPDGVEISNRSIGLHSFVTVAVAGTWDIISLNQFGNPASLTAPGASPLPWMFVAIGVGLTIFAVLGLLGSTHTILRGGRLTAKRRPLPFFTTIKLELPSIRLLSVLRNQPRRSGPSTFEVFAVTHDRRSIKIARGLRSLEEGELIKKEIESWLARKP